MRRVAGALSGVVALVAALLPAQPARAVAPPTLSGPARVQYYAPVTLTGTTPHPAERVDVWFRDAGQPRATARYRLTSDAAGRFTTTYRADHTDDVFARTSEGVSATITVRTARADCWAGGPAFTTLTGPDQAHASAQVTAVRGTTWAGVVVTADDRLALFTWHGGTPTYLGTYGWPNLDHSTAYSLRAIGFAPDYTLVTRQQDPHSTGGAGYYWRGGVRRIMSHGSSWLTWAPTGVSRTGEVVGWALTGGHYYVVTWAGPAAAYHLVAYTGTNFPQAQIDGQGDLAWSSSTGHAWIRTAGGRYHLMHAGGEYGDAWTSALAHPSGASLNAFYSAGRLGVERWLVDAASPDGTPWRATLVSGPVGDSVDAVGQWNSLTVGDRTPYLRTNLGGFVRMPEQLPSDYQYLNAVDDAGHVAFTAADDGRVHFLHCTTH